MREGGGEGGGDGGGGGCEKQPKKIAKEREVGRK